MTKILCMRCGHEILLETAACPACGFIGPLTGLNLPPVTPFALSEADAVKIARGLLMSDHGSPVDGNGSPVEA